MEFAVIDRWTDASVYLDLVSRRLMTFQGHSLHIVEADHLTKAVFQLEVQDLKNVALSPDRLILGFVQDSSRLVMHT
jgi:hypothetical protein